jgi:ectoine hydroxylase-related dioxygenase (phytanoyl-CoA dioxygenase family)
MSLSKGLDATFLRRSRQDYERDGVACLRGVIDQPWLALLEAGIAASMTAPSPHVEQFGPVQGRGRFYADIGLAARFPEIERFLRESPAAELAARLMRSRAARLFFEQLLVKEAGADHRTPWHQDLPYWPVSGSRVCSMWIPVDRVPREVGMEFIAGSHRWQEHSPRRFQDGAAYGPPDMPRLPDIEAERAAHRIVSFDLQPGDCLVFHAMTAHGASANTGAVPRRAISIRWLGDGTRHRRRLAAEPGQGVGSAATDGQLIEGADYPLLWPRARVP